MAARKNRAVGWRQRDGATWDQSVRDRIKSTKLIESLQRHVFDNVDMKPTQITAALGLLKKTVPDLSVMEHKGSIDLPRADDLTDDELAAYIERDSSANVAQAAIDPAKLN